MSAAATLGNLESEIAAAMRHPAEHPSRIAAELAAEAAKQLLAGQEALASSTGKLQDLKNALRLVNAALGERVNERRMLQNAAAVDLIDAAVTTGKVQLPDYSASVQAEHDCWVIKRANELLAEDLIPTAEIEKQAAEAELLRLESEAYGSHAQWRAAHLGSKLGEALDFDSSMQVGVGEETAELSRLSNLRIMQHATALQDLSDLKRRNNR